MNCPYIKVLTNDWQLVAELDTFTALELRRSWQGVGDFTLVLVGDRYPDCIVRNRLLMVGEDPHRVGIVRYINPVVSPEGVTTTIRGTMLNGLTSQRVVLPQNNNGGYFSVPLISDNRKVPAEEIIKTMISACLGTDAAVNRRIRDANGRLLLTIPPSQGRGYRTEWGCRYPQLDEELQALCEYCDCGYEIYGDLLNRMYVAEFLPGLDRSVHNTAGNDPVILSSAFESMLDVEYTEDYTSYRNLAYCGGKGDGDNRAVIAVTNAADTPQGFDRYETWIDCGELENVESDTAMSLRTTGKHKLEEFDFVQTLTATVAQTGAFRYGEQWDLGDLVTIREETLGLEQDIRITEVCESYAPADVSLTVTLGKPPKRIHRAIRNIRNEVR